MYIIMFVVNHNIIEFVVINVNIVCVEVIIDSLWQKQFVRYMLQ